MQLFFVGCVCRLGIFREEGWLLLSKGLWMAASSLFFAFRIRQLGWFFCFLVFNFDIMWFVAKIFAIIHGAEKFSSVLYILFGETYE